MLGFQSRILLRFQPFRKSSLESPSAIITITVTETDKVRYYLETTATC